MDSKQPERPVCPLYITGEKNKIMCRSVLPDASYTAMAFPTIKLCENQRSIYCCDNYKFCEQYISFEHFNWTDGY